MAINDHHYSIIEFLNWRSFEGIFDENGPWKSHENAAWSMKSIISGIRKSKCNNKWTVISQSERSETLERVGLRDARNDDPHCRIRSNDGSMERSMIELWRWITFRPVLYQRETIGLREGLARRFAWIKMGSAKKLRRLSKWRAKNYPKVDQNLGGVLRI